MNEALPPRTYGAYGGHVARAPGALTAYAGEIGDPDANHYLLGERVYLPSLRRFLAPDSLSPFAMGGINRYAYCNGDPIGRIDPGGHSWLSWVKSTLDRLDLPLTTARRASGGEDVFVSPTLMAAATASRRDADSLASLSDTSSKEEILATLKSYGNARVPVTGSDATSTSFFDPRGGYFGILWPQRGSTKSGTMFTPDKRTIHAIQGPSVFSGDPRRANLASRGKVYPQWVERTNAAGGIHVATTTTINTKYLHELKNYIQRRYPDRNVTVLAGAHSQMHGRNWGRDGERIGPEPAFFHQTAQKAQELDWRVDMLDYSTLRSAQVDSLLREGTGVFVHMTCFSAADELFMKAFNIPDITVRML